MLADILSGLIARAEFAVELAESYSMSSKEYLKRIGYSIINVLARNGHEFPDKFFEYYIHVIEKELQTSPNRAKEGMNNCLIAIGGRNEHFKSRVFKAADKIGLVEIDHGETNCKTFDIKEYVVRIHARKKVRGK